MFERYESDRGGGPKRRWVRICVIASAIAHVGVVAALVISSWWHIDKLKLDERSVGVASLGYTSAAPPPLASERTERKTIELERTTDLTQKTDRERDATEDSGGGEGDPDGQAGGKAGGTGNDPLADNLFSGCGQVLCNGDAPPPPRPVKEPEPKAPVVVPEAMLKGHLISGNTQIQAPDAVKVKIARTADRRVVGVVKLCIDAGGRVTSSSLLKSTGHQSYDRRLVSGVRRWRYKPYRVGGKPAAVCTSVRFLYILRD